ncbi:helix-turn-helix domain-containing protein [Sutcliffiella sp. NC1]|uniref:helix-turn-helix domain-containing protein n=1 Tax=Sutcliffiella sp. NC1 TaxID=3004096 RepID=UPI0022DD1C5D|nr:helix-turn-helix transcriptional regulator [Sutcliffiella sp. NC1]WBL15233.1 helix-turn-helix transcriptional regulator [Sutcliffiella sp. NC1]
MGTRSFGEILKEKRMERGLSLRQLSEISNIEASYINRLEKGDRENPGFSTVCALAKALNVSGDEILNSFGYEQLGSNQKSEVTEVDSLIQGYITEVDAKGYIPRIISLLEDARHEYQNKN